MSDVFELLTSKSGGYNLPYLIQISDIDDTVTFRFVNDTQDITYEDEVYTAETFEYIPNAEAYGFDGGGTLTIPSPGNNIIDLIDMFRRIKLVVVGVLRSGDDVFPIKFYQHSFGNALVNRRQITITFKADDQMNMTFPGLIFSHYNNRGN